MRGPPVAWSCSDEVAVGDVTGSSYFNVNAKGEPIQSGDQWEWRTSDRDFRVSVIHGFFQADIQLFVDIPNRLLKEGLAAIELRTGALDRPQSNPALVRRTSAAIQYNFPLTRAQLEQFATSAQAFYVVGVKSNGQVIRWVKFDTTALARGEAALASAKEQVAARARDYRAKCSPMYAGDPPVIA